MNNENEKQELVNSINILLLEKKELNDELNRINKRRIRIKIKHDKIIKKLTKELKRNYGTLNDRLDALHNSYEEVQDNLESKYNKLSEL
jgi:chaperonin cofactor prefoldin